MKVEMTKMILGLKIALFVYIIISPYIPLESVSIINNIVFKVLCLILIVVATFVDIQLAIIMSIGFLVLMLNLNKNKVIKIKKQKESFIHKEKYSDPEFIYKNPEMTEVKQPPFFETMVKMPETQCNDMNFYKQQISNDLFDIYIDDKVKPYQETIRKITSPNQLDIIQTNEI